MSPEEEASGNGLVLEARGRERNARLQATVDRAAHRPAAS